MKGDFVGNVIITNNPLVRDAYDNILYIEGTVEDVLVMAKDLVDKGYKIISHPLPGTVQIVVSPVKSIVLRKSKVDRVKEQSVALENSITKFQNYKKNKDLDFINLEDYKKLDLELLRSALGE